MVYQFGKKYRFHFKWALTTPYADGILEDVKDTKYGYMLVIYWAYDNYLKDFRLFEDTVLSQDKIEEI